MQDACCSDCSANSVNRTYASAMYQFLAENSAAARKSERASRLIPGAIANGPMYRSIIPTSPLTPIIISNRDATMIAPCICNSYKRANS